MGGSHDHVHFLSLSSLCTILSSSLSPRYGNSERGNEDGEETISNILRSHWAAIDAITIALAAVCRLIALHLGVVGLRGMEIQGNERVPRTECGSFFSNNVMER